jgi:protein phosphatase
MSDYIPQFRWSGMTHMGRVRKNNEDAFLGMTFNANETHYLGKIGEASLTHEDFLFAVSDGMGGANGGEYASRIVVENLTRLVPRSFRLSAMGMHPDYTEILSEIFSNIHHKIESMSRSYEECRGMGATLSLCWFSPEKMHFAHIGDSLIYYLPKDGDLKCLSESHTVTGRLVREGKISPAEARRHPDKCILERGLGGHMRNYEPQIGAVTYRPGDIFILCSDGISDSLFESNIVNQIRRPSPHLAEKPPAQRLVNQALFESGRDNLTALVIEVLGN